MMDEDFLTEVISGLSLFGVTKEHHTLKLLLKTGPDSSTPSGSVVGEVGRRLVKMRNRFVPELEAYLLDHDEIKISNLVNLAGDGEGSEEGPLVATVEGDFYLFKSPKIGAELLCEIMKISSQRLTCSVAAGDILDVFQFTPDRNDLYVGQKIICVVEDVTFSDSCQMRISGRLVKFLNTISMSSSEGGSRDGKGQGED